MSCVGAYIGTGTYESFGDEDVRNSAESVQNVRTKGGIEIKTPPSEQSCRVLRSSKNSRQQPEEDISRWDTLPLSVANNGDLDLSDL